MGQGGILAPFGMTGIQERHTFCGTFTEFCFVLVAFEIVTSIYTSNDSRRKCSKLDNVFDSEDTARVTVFHVPVKLTAYWERQT